MTYRNNRSRTSRRRQRELADVERLTLSDAATIYGCCGLFDMCGDEDLLSLSMEGASAFLDWLGWERTNVCKIHKDFIAWVRPEQVGGVCTEGYVGDPCADGHGVEWGTCDFELLDFGRVRRHGPVRDITKNDVVYCERSPRYRLDGTPITDDREYDARVISEAVLQDIKRYTITGDAAVAGQWDGLEQIVTDGYQNTDGSTCELMDSIVIDWNFNGVNGGAGITWNNGAIAATFSLIDVIIETIRKIRWRISLSPTLAAQPMRTGDIVLMLPTFMVNCILDAFTCWSVCEGRQYNEVNLQTLEARRFRNDLNGSTFGFGRITVDNMEIPLIAFDWNTIQGPTSGDIYVLTGQIGAVKVLQYQYNDMDMVPRSGYPNADGFFASDGGKFLHYAQYDHTCVEQYMEIQPRILAWAPWALARIQDVVCNTVFGPFSADPCDTSFFIGGTSLSQAVCP